MILTFVLTSLIVIECIATTYLPEILEKHITNIKNNRFINLENFENIASGAVLALAFIHLLPEAIILSNAQKLNFYLIFIIVVLSVTFLNITDILHENNENDILLEDKNNSKWNQNENTDEKSGTSTNNELAKQSTCDNVELNNDTNKTIADKKLKNEMNQDIEMNCKNESAGKNEIVEPVKMKNDKKSQKYCALEIIRSNAFFIALSLFVHSFVEGILLGGLKDASSIIIVALSFLAHKWAECLIIRKSVLTKVNNKQLKLVYAWSFILALPIGVIVAMFSLPPSDLVDIIFGSIACGFFIYLSFNITKTIKITEINKYFIALSYCIGIFGMSGLMLAFTFFEEMKS